MIDFMAMATKKRVVSLDTNATMTREVVQKLCHRDDRTK